MRLFRNRSTDKRRLLADALGVIGVCSLIAAFVVFALQTVDRTPSRPSSPPESTTNLGLIYMPVGPELAQEYRLGTDSGAFVTHVVEGSPADQAGLQVGDVITSLNGCRIDQHTPLFGMMRTCRPGDDIVIEIWRQDSLKTLTIIPPPAN